MTAPRYSGCPWCGEGIYTLPAEGGPARCGNCGVPDTLEPPLVGGGQGHAPQSVRDGGGILAACILTVVIPLALAAALAYYLGHNCGGH